MLIMKTLVLAGIAILATCARLSADGPADNLVDKVRPVPPQGIKVSVVDRQELSQGIEQLGKAVADLRSTLKGKAALLELLPDVQIYHNAVRYALNHNEFHKV